MNTETATAEVSSEPGSETATTARPKKPIFPLVADGETLITDLDQLADYDSSQYRPLKKANFEHGWMEVEWRARGLEAKVKALREEAEQMKKLGAIADNAKAKRVLQLQKSLAKLMEGLDDEDAALIAELSGDSDE